MEQAYLEKEKLVEEMGVYFEITQQLTPLASRIYALLGLCPKAGHSFEEIIELTKSSKSSVSTNINLLLQSGIIEYYTKSGDRKRYFRLSKKYLVVNLEKLRNRAVEELTLFDKINSYNRTYNPKKFEKHREIVGFYQEYLKTQYRNLESTINKMKQIEN